MVRDGNLSWVREIPLSVAGKWWPAFYLMIWRVLRVDGNGQGVILINVSAVRKILQAE